MTLGTNATLIDGVLCNIGFLFLKARLGVIFGARDPFFVKSDPTPRRSIISSLLRPCYRSS